MRRSTRKRWIAMLLVLVITVTNCNVLEVSAETTADGYEYSVLKNEMVQITDYTGTDKELVIPSEINGKKVTSIGDYAFEGCKSLTSITIPDSVTSIGHDAFKYCYSLTSITIPDSVTSIGGYAFYYCNSLTSITIPDSVTSIGGYAFHYCDSLTSIEVNDENKVYNSSNNCNAIIETKTNQLIRGCVNTIIPDSVTSIGNGAFSACGSLTSITIPDSVTSIGNQAFEYCRSLTSITIPDSVTSIGYAAFYYCDSLTSITIPDSVTSIGDHAFRNCKSLTSITIPDSVTSIGEWTFYYCDSLTSITIPDSVTSIGERAFYYCDSLTSITIPDSVTSIGDYAFRYCPDTMIVYANAGSTAAQYAEENGFTVKPINGNLPEGEETPIKDKVVVTKSIVEDKDGYGFIVLNKETGEPVPNVTWWMDMELEKKTTGEDEAQFGFKATTTLQERHTIHVQKTGYVPNSVVVDVAFGKGKTIPIYLEPYAGGVYIETLQVSTKNKTGTTDKVNTMSRHKWIDTTSDTHVYIEATGNCLGENQTIAAFEIAQSEYEMGKIPKSDIIGKYNINASYSIPIEKFEDQINVYIRGIDSNGIKGDWQKTNIIVLKGSSKISTTVDLGSDITFSVPKNIPVIGGQSFQVSGWKDLPVQASRGDDGTIRIGINLGNASTDGSDGLGHSATWNEIKDVAKKQIEGKAYDKKVKEFRSQRGDAFKREAFSIGKSSTKSTTSVDVWGYLEGNENKNINGKYEVTGTLVVELSAGMGTVIPYNMGSIPMVFTIDLKGELSGELDAKIQFENFEDLNDLDNYGIEGTLNPSITLDVGTGPGFGDLAYVTANVRGTIGSEIKWPVLAEGQFNSPNGRNVTADLTIGASIKAKLLFWSASHNFAETSMQLYEHSDSAMVNINSLMNPDSYTLDFVNVQYSLDNVGDSSYARMSQTNINSDGTVICSNIDSESQVLYVDNNGTKIAIYTIQDTSRVDINQNKLVYSIYQEGESTWSEPMSVLDDGTCDYYPCIAYDDHDVYLAWVNLRSVLSAEDVTMESSAAQTEVILTKYDADTQKFETLYTSDNEEMDYAHSLSIQDGVVYMSWICNTNNNLLCNDASNSIKMLKYASEEEEEKVVASNLSNVLESASGMIGDTECVAYVEDADGDYTTVEDRKLHIIDVDGTQIYENEACLSASHIMFETFKDENILIWSQNGLLYGLDNIAETPSVLIDEEAYVNGKYQFYENDNYAYVLFLTEVEGDVLTASRLNAYVYDKNLNSWSKQIQLSKDDLYASSYSASVNTDGTLDIIVANADVELQDEEYVTNANLYFAATERSTDIVLENVSYDDYVVTETGNTVDVVLSVINKGENFVEDYTVQLLKGETVIDEATLTQMLVPGESCDLTHTFSLPDEMGTEEEYTVKIVVQDDCNEEDNHSTITLGYANLDFALGEYTSFGQIHTFSVNVVNNGPISSSGVVEVHQGDVSGPVVNTINIDTLSPDSQNSISVIINSDEVNWSGDRMQYFLTLSSDIVEKDTVQNTESFCVSKEPETKQAYVVSFTSSSEEVTGDVPENVYCSENVEITIPGNENLVREGYVFTGWNTQMDGSGDLYKAGDILTINADIALYAQWKRDMSCVTASVVVPYVFDNYEKEPKG